MNFPPEVLAPARHPGESYADYCMRRSVADEAVRRYLAGQYSYQHPPYRRVVEAGIDEGLDEQIRRGDLVVVHRGVDQKGEYFRLVQPRRIPYRKPTA